MRQHQNSAQQRTHTVSQLSNAYHVGTLLGEYPQTRKPELIRTLKGCGVLLLGLLLITLAVYFLGPLVAIAGAVLSALGLAYSLDGYFYLVSRRMYAFTGGFIYFKGGKPVVFRWEDMRFFQEIRIRQGLITFHSVKITHADGHSVTFQIRDIAPFLSLISAHVALERKPTLLKAYEAGKVLKFGPLDVSREGVSYQKRLLPWPEIDQIFLLSGTLHIRTVKEKQSDWATILEAERIPSISLFLELTKDILKAKRPSL